jgi:hypothetical protein
MVLNLRTKTGLTMGGKSTSLVERKARSSNEYTPARRNDVSIMWTTASSGISSNRHSGPYVREELKPLMSRCSLL